MNSDEFVEKKENGILITAPIDKMEFVNGNIQYRNVRLTIKDGRIVDERPALTRPHFCASATFGEGHAHIAMNGDTDFEQLVDTIENKRHIAVEIARENFAKSIKNGITVWCDLGPAGGKAVPFFQELLRAQKEENGAMIPAQWVYAAWTVVGSPEAFAAPFCRIIKNFRDLRKFFGESSANGATVVKIIAETELLKEKGFGYDFVFPDELLLGTVEYARFHNFITAMHAKGALSVEKGIWAGADCLEHAIQASTPQLKDSEKKNIYIGATLAGLSCRLKHAEKTGFCLEEARYEWAAVKSMVKSATELHNDGSPATNFVAASDSGSEATPHPSLLDELQLMHSCGFTAPFVLSSSIVNVRKLLRLPESGSLRSGERADIIFWEKNPVKVLESGQPLESAIAAVMMGGRIVHISK